MSSKPITVTCTCCGHSFEVNVGRLLGQRTSAKKSEASRLNGRLGGRQPIANPVRLRPYHPGHPKHQEWLAEQKRLGLR